MLQEKLNKLRRFGKDERSSFPYWFAHWKAFNMVALQLGHWKFKYLFHDIEKPWLMLLWKDYKRVQKWHRAHNTHHIDTKRSHFDFEAMCIDWECSRYTKIGKEYNAFETLWNEMDARHANGQLCFDVWKGVGTVLCEFGLATKDEVGELIKRWFDKYGYHGNENN